jgi:L-fucose isomerase-like protein
MSEEAKVNVGFVGFGEVNTPPEFIVERCKAAAAQLREAGLNVLETAPVSDDPGGEQSARAAAELAELDFDALVLCVAGWIPSWAVFKTIENFRHKPMVLLGLSGWQEGSRFVTTADQAGTTALRLPMAEMGYTFKYVVTRRGGKLPVEEVACYCRAAAAAVRLRGSLLGMAGYRDMRLYGTTYDGTSLKGRIGPEIEHFDLLELQGIMEKISDDEVAGPAAELKNRWEFVREPQAGTVENSVRFYLAVRRKIEERGYAAFSYNDVDGVKKLLGFAPAGAMTLLHDEITIPTVPENDALGSVTQLMVHYLTGQIGAYLEFYEFTEDGALMGVPDYVPAEIVDGKVTVMPNAFGSFGEGLLNVSKLKTGKVTLARLVNSGGDYRLHAVTAEAAAPIPWEEAGWAPPAPQLPSLDLTFDVPAEEFIANVMSQHYIISYGDNLGELRDLCSILGVQMV